MAFVLPPPSHHGAGLFGSCSAPGAAQAPRHCREMRWSAALSGDRAWALVRGSTCGADRCRRRRRVVCAPRAESPYDVLGVPRTATEKQIKTAYRKLALKCHPDVNKAPDAEKQFMRIKQAYQALTEPTTASAHGNRDRASAGRSSATSARGPPSGFDWDPFSQNQSPQEPFYGLDDFFRDLAADFEKRQKAGGKPKSLWEELADLGEEFVEFLEKELRVEDSKEGGQTTGSGNVSTSGNSRASPNSYSYSSGSSESAKSREEDKFKDWADDLGKKSKEVVDDIEEELKKLKREMGL